MPVHTQPRTGARADLLVHHRPAALQVLPGLVVEAWPGMCITVSIACSLGLDLPQSPARSGTERTCGIVPDRRYSVFGSGIKASMRSTALHWTVLCFLGGCQLHV